MSETQIRRRLTPTVFQEADGPAVALLLVQGLLLTATFGAFFLESAWTTPLLAGFLLVSGVTWSLRQAVAARALTFMMTLSTGLILGLIAIFLFLEAIPAFDQMGLGLVVPTGETLWALESGVVSLVPMIWGTVVTTAVATLVAAPLGVGGALYISEIAPDWVRSFAKPGVEMLAGIPSIVYGFIGFTIVVPYMDHELGTPAGGPLAIIGLVIGFMALPTVVSVAEDAISTVPESMKGGSLATGATDWQTMKSVTIPAAFSGISAAVLLGVGRAIGETMAATVMIAHLKALPDPVYDVFQSTETLTTFIAGNYGNAQGNELFMSTLFAAGVVLFLIVTTLSVASQYVERRMERKLGGET